MPERLGHDFRPASSSLALATFAWGFVVAGASGCGGGLPLLYPAQTLAGGEIRAAAGLSSDVATLGLSQATKTASNEAAVGGGTAPSGSDATYAKGALATASVGTGIAPYVAARVGIGADAEGGITYTGRAVRGDIRRSFDLAPKVALSAGIGGSVVLYGRQDGESLPGVDLQDLHGVGADLPVIVGYRSTAGLYMAWIGARAGFEHVGISALTSEPGTTTFGGPPISLSATRWWGGGLVGVAAGFRHVHVAMELDVSYADVSGNYDQTQARVDGVTLAPSAALLWDF
jgi:hypothetical protein